MDVAAFDIPRKPSHSQLLDEELAFKLVVLFYYAWGSLCTQSKQGLESMGCQRGSLSLHPQAAS